MSKALPFLSALALVASTVGVVAQSSDQSDQPAVTVPPGLSTGTPVAPEAPAAAEERTYVKASNGAWEVQCLRLPEGTQGEDPCQMYQLLRDQQGASVAEISIFRLATPGPNGVVAGGTFVVPLETLLTENLTLQIDSGQAVRYEFSFCAPVGCYARVGFTEADITRLKAGANGQVTIVPAQRPDARVVVNMSLSGFTASFDEVSEIRSAN